MAKMLDERVKSGHHDYHNLYRKRDLCCNMIWCVQIVLAIYRIARKISGKSDKYHFVEDKDFTIIN